MSWILLLVNLLGAFGQSWTATKFLDLYDGPDIQHMPWGVAWKPDMSSMFVVGSDSPTSKYWVLRYDYPNGTNGPAVLGCSWFSYTNIVDLTYYRGRLFAGYGAKGGVGEYDPNTCARIQDNTVILPTPVGQSQTLGLRVDPISGDLFACTTNFGVFRFPIPPTVGGTSSYTLYYTNRDGCDGIHFDYDGSLWVVNEGCQCLVHLPASTTQTDPTIPVTELGRTIQLGPIDGIASTLGCSGTPPTILVTNNNDGTITAYDQTSQIKSIIYSGTGANYFRGDFCVTAMNGCVYLSHQLLGKYGYPYPTTENPESIWQLCANDCSGFIPENSPCLPHPCDTNAECTPGGSSDFTCACNSGYIGDGSTCQLCTPRTCSGLNCGSIDDGCGGNVTCGGDCTLPQTCGGGGIDNVCGCTKKTCAVGACGVIPDGCGGTLDCGGCTSPQNCGGGGIDNVCGCTPLTCCPSNLNCGSISDNCGGTISCGECQGQRTCGEEGHLNVCGCHITKSAPTITLTVSNTSAAKGQSVTFTATVHLPSSASYDITTSNFAIEQIGNDRPVSCVTETISGSNPVTVTCVSKTLPLGDHKYFASFSDDEACVAPARSHYVQVHIRNAGNNNGKK